MFAVLRGLSAAQLPEPWLAAKSLAIRQALAPVFRPVDEI
jgi:hypothetical protein